MMVRPPCCSNLNVRKGIWREEGDAKILPCIPKHGTGNWTSAPKKTGLRKCGKSCSRLRSKSYLRPDLRQESFTPQEEELIIRLHSAIGSRWLIIAQQLPGRTDNDVKNYWNTKLKKKLSAMGIDPVTHRPFSQILVDYGNIGGGLPRARTGRLGSLSRDMIKTAVFLSNQEPLPFPTESFLNPNIKMEPTTELKTDSIDLLTQLQSITLVKEASNEISSSQFHSEFSSSASASSSTENDILWPTQSISWHDYLLEDEFPPGNGQEQETQMPPQAEINTEENPDYEELARNDIRNKAASDGSFVECLIDGDNIDMFLDFPGLLEEPFYY